MPKKQTLRRGPKDRGAAAAGRPSLRRPDDAQTSDRPQADTSTDRDEWMKKHAADGTLRKPSR